MNVDHVYQLQRDEAFAEQFTANSYRTFVAMPFSNRGGYPEKRIKGLLKRCHDRANQQLGCDARRKFSKLERVDEAGAAAIVITDEIIRRILETHFFVGDLTGGNLGVVLETGIALALKPNGRVLLFTQDDTTSLHFDLKVTNVSRYTEDQLVKQVGTGLAQAARVFEDEADRYIRLLSSRLTPNGISLLNIYGVIWKERGNLAEQPSLFEESAAVGSVRFKDAVGKVAFHIAVRELFAHRLVWTDYKSNVQPGVDACGIHATKLGWRVIEHLWQHDAKMRQPKNALTGPNS